MGDETDAEVIAESSGDPERFGAIFARHHQVIFGYFARRLGRHSAEDLTVEVFIRAFDRRDTFDTSRDSARPWLFGIARYVFLNHQRARRAERTGPLFDTDVPIDDHASSVSAAVDASIVLRDPRLAEAIASLHPDIVETLLLFAVEELTYGEISQVMDVPLGTVRSRLGRARAAIREHTGRGPRTGTGDEDGT